MAKRMFFNQSYTPTGTADTTALPNGYQALKGGSATQLSRILEIFIGGQAGASGVNAMLFARHSTVATTPTALAAGAGDGPAHPATAALAAPAVTFTAAATGGQRSAVTTDPKLILSLNPFGGIVRWFTGPESEFWVLGNTAALFGEVSLSALNIGTPGLIGSHIIYEPY